MKKIATIRSPFGEFYAILNRLPYLDKEEIVFQFSGGKTVSIVDLFNNHREQFDNMLSKMRELLTKTDNQHNPDMAEQKELKKLRHQILIKLQKIGVDTTNWDDVNTYISDNRLAGKPLYECNEQELKLVLKTVKIIEKRHTKNKITDIQNTATQTNAGKDKVVSSTTIDISWLKGKYFA